jgi:leucyl/phenylalanyl-tRNA--protein transferase
MTELVWLERHSYDFPPVEHALHDPDGLLAVGGDLSLGRLVRAYSQGIFPWYEDGQPILWWSPDPRAVLKPGNVKISRSLRKKLRRKEFVVKIDTAFDQVLDLCQAPRSYSLDTWITDEMKNAYSELHKAGFAHSIECYCDEEMVGGLYGVSKGNLFFGESMFHKVTDASKVAFVYLCRLLAELNCPIIDCQLPNPHIMSLGVEIIPRLEFLKYLSKNNQLATEEGIDWASLRGTRCFDF